VHELARTIPDANLLLTLEPEELGAKLLFLVRKRLIPDLGALGLQLSSGVSPSFQHDSGAERLQPFHPQNLIGELWPQTNFSNQQTIYPRQQREVIDLALTEAWAWLEAQGLIVPAAGANGENGWKRLSRSALRFESEAEFAQYAVARTLPRDVLHARIADRVWMAFMRGDFDVAAFQAMKAVEVSVRDAGGLGDELIGVKLMRAAFAPEGGPLTDMTAEGGERVGRMELFACAIGSYKNPHSHRDVNLDDLDEALGIIMLANR
jgi:uncharacterized protein (TIGR02391 family)